MFDCADVVRATRFPGQEPPAALFLLGFRRAGDGGHALYKHSRRAPAHAGRIQSADGAWWELAEAIVSPQMFGARGNGLDDDSLAIAAANSYCEVVGAPLFFPAATYLVGSASFILRASRTRWYSESQASLLWNSPPASAALTILGEDDYPNRYRQCREVLKGIALIGGGQRTQYLAIGLQFGDGSRRNVTSHVRVADCAIQGWQTAITYTDNVYFIELDHCGIQWGGIETPSTTTNFGETMIIRGCFIADSSYAINLRRGEWKFHHCSLDNICLSISNDTVVEFDAGHMENPGSANVRPRFAEIRDEASLSMRGSYITLNRPTSARAIIDPIFWVETSPGVATGLALDGCTWVQGGQFDPRLGGNLRRSLCGGQGRVRVRSCNVHSWKNSNYYLIGDGANELANPEFSLGNTSGWIHEDDANSSQRSSFIADADVHLTGTFSGKLTARNNSRGHFNAKVYQTIPVRSGDLVCVSLYYRNESALEVSQGSIKLSLVWYDGGGTSISDAGSVEVRGASSAWAEFYTGGMAPPGASTVRLELACRCDDAQPDPVCIWIDSAVLNVVRN